MFTGYRYEERGSLTLLSIVDKEMNSFENLNDDWDQIHFNKKKVVNQKSL